MYLCNTQIHTSLVIWVADRVACIHVVVQVFRIPSVVNDVVMMAIFQQMVLPSMYMYAHQYMYIHVVQIVAGNSTEFLLFSN